MKREEEKQQLEDKILKKQKKISIDGQRQKNLDRETMPGERQERLLGQKEKELQVKTAEAAQMARLIQEEKDASEKQESGRKDVEVRLQRLQNEVEDMTKEKGGIQREDKVA
ncbi:reticulocyte-binding protein homolog 2a-like [Macrobrachium nipponense]|uniref:reticulocyte-binding protein homolog 2a-like n=1 Tax=Macrobrachium nipponense TaxID=159736 RepID=UPI0030C7B554